MATGTPRATPRATRPPRTQPARPPPLSLSLPSAWVTRAVLAPFGAIVCTDAEATPDGNECCEGFVCAPAATTGQPVCSRVILNQLPFEPVAGASASGITFKEVQTCSAIGATCSSRGTIVITGWGPASDTANKRIAGGGTTLSTLPCCAGSVCAPHAQTGDPTCSAVARHDVAGTTKAAATGGGGASRVVQPVEQPAEQPEGGAGTEGDCCQGAVGHFVGPTRNLRHTKKYKLGSSTGKSLDQCSSECLASNVCNSFSHKPSKGICATYFFASSAGGKTAQGHDFYVRPRRRAPRANVVCPPPPPCVSPRTTRSAARGELSQRPLYNARSLSPAWHLSGSTVAQRCLPRTAPRQQRKVGSPHMSIAACALAGPGARDQVPPALHNVRRPGSPGGREPADELRFRNRQQARHFHRGSQALQVRQERRGLRQAVPGERGLRGVFVRLGGQVVPHGGLHGRRGQRRGQLSSFYVRSKKCRAD